MNTSLTPCPRCSSRTRLVRPEWAYADKTSARRKVRCFIWVGGCGHGVDFQSTRFAPLKEETEAGEIEAIWHAHALELFSALTARWTPAQRALHARALGIELPPDPPAQQQPKTDNEK